MSFALIFCLLNGFQHFSFDPANMPEASPFTKSIKLFMHFIPKFIWGKAQY